MKNMKTKSAYPVRILALFLVVFLTLWLIPSNLVFANEGDVTSSDTTPPIITLIGDNPVIAEVGSTYTDKGVTASDDVDGDLTGSVVVVNNVDTALVGSYTVTHNVIDSSKNAAAEVTRTVVVEATPIDSGESTPTDPTPTDPTPTDPTPTDPTEPVISDTTPPVITLIGSSILTVEVGSTYKDEGANANDDVDGDLAGSMVVVSNVSTSVAASYTVTYNVSDKAKNAAAEVVRTVNVVKAVSLQEEIYSASLNVVAKPSSVDPGENVTFKIIVNNTGTMPLSDIKVIDKLPDLVIFTPVDGLVYDDILREVSFTIANLNPGEIYQKEIIVAVPLIAADSIILTNRVDISGDKITTIQKKVDIDISTSSRITTTDPKIQNYNPFIYTDKDDYQPGGKVTLFGEGFVPGEDVQIIFYAITTEIPAGEIEHFTVIDDVGEDGTFVYEYNIIGAEKYRVEARSVVKNDNGITTPLESGTTEIKVQSEVTINDFILGFLLAWTQFTDTALGEITLSKYGLRYDFSFSDEAIFTLKDSTNTVIGTATLDNAWHTSLVDNTVTWKDLAEGNYVITETWGTNNYTYTSHTHNVTIPSTGNKKFDVVDTNISSDGKANILLLEGKHGARSTEWSGSQDDGGLKDPVVWHFVVPSGYNNPSLDDRLYVKIQFSDNSIHEFTVEPSSKDSSTTHFYLGTNLEGTLLDAFLVTSKAPQPPGAKVTLSHCDHNTTTGKVTVTKGGLTGTDNSLSAG